MRFLLVVAVAGSLAGCPADDAVVEPDATPDSLPVDAALLECPIVTPPEPPASTLPTGAWWGAWSCVSGCDLPAPPLSGATRVELGVGADSYADWRMGTPTVERTPMGSAGNCWHVEATGERCRSAFDICGQTCTGGGDCVLVPLVTWTDLATGRQQAWTFSADRFL